MKATLQIFVWGCGKAGVTLEIPWPLSTITRPMHREEGGCSFWKVRDRHDKLDVVLSPDTEEEPESGCFSERGTSLGGCAGESGEATASALH